MRRPRGYLEINHKDSPGLSDNEALWFEPDLPPGACKGGTVFKAKIITCPHCQKQMIHNPNRTRERFLCRKCDDYICDDCAWWEKISGTHRSFKAVIDETLNAITKGLPVPIFERPRFYG